MWCKLSTEMRNKPSLNAFKVAIRKMDVCGLMDNNLNCCDLCKTWLSLVFIFTFCILYKYIYMYRIIYYFYLYI